jgi:hypothetical protein
MGNKLIVRELKFPFYTKIKKLRARNVLQLENFIVQANLFSSKS